MAVAEFNGDGRIAVQTEYRERDAIKQVPGARWDAKHRVWTVALSWAACVQLRSVFGADLKVGERLAAWAREERDTRVSPACALRSADDSEDLAALYTKLYPYQRAGVAFLRTAGCALVADEMGLGKTVQTIATLDLLDAYPALVVCPNSVKAVWEDEYEKWSPGRRVVVVGGGAAKRRKALEQVAAGEYDVAVMNWEALRLHTKMAGYGSQRLEDKEKEPKELNFVQWRAVVADEAHRAKDPRAKQTRALWGVSEDTEHRYALTGTPVANAPEDLWSVMHFVAPLEFPARTRFIDRYCLQSWNNFGFMETVGLRPDTKEELFSVLDPRMIRRTKAAVLPQLPPKVYTRRSVEMATKQKKAYEQMRQTLLAELEEGVLVATNPLAKMTRLIQFASAYGEIVDGALKLTAPSCKVDALLEIAEELGEQKAVVFAESRQLLEVAAVELQKAGYLARMVTGAVHPGDRADNIQSFQEGSTQFLLVTMGAGGEGLTLTAASAAVFLQRSFSAVKNAQAEDRLHRPGQENDSVEIIDVITENTVEARVHQLSADKRGRLEEVVRDEASLRELLSK